MKTSLGLAVVVTALLISSSASAGIVDFTDASVWGDADGQSSASATIDGVEIILSADPEPYAKLSHSSGGIGIDFFDVGSESYQIDGIETLTVDFDQLVVIEDMDLSNIYDWGFVVEVGSYTIDGTSEQFSGESSGGDLHIDVGSIPTTKVTFRARLDSFSDFSLAGLSFSLASVPELDPDAGTGAIALILGGVIVLMGRRRRRLA